MAWDGMRWHDINTATGLWFPWQQVTSWLGELASNVSSTDSCTFQILLGRHSHFVRSYHSFAALMSCEVEFVKALSICIATVFEFGRNFTHFLKELGNITSWYLIYFANFKENRQIMLDHSKLKIAAWNYPVSCLSNVSLFRTERVIVHLQT